MDARGFAISVLLAELSRFTFRGILNACEALLLGGVCPVVVCKIGELNRRSCLSEAGAASEDLFLGDGLVLHVDGGGRSATIDSGLSSSSAIGGVLSFADSSRPSSAPTTAGGLLGAGGLEGVIVLDNDVICESVNAGTMVGGGGVFNCEVDGSIDLRLVVLYEDNALYGDLLAPFSMLPSRLSFVVDGSLVMEFVREVMPEVLEM